MPFIEVGCVKVADDTDINYFLDVCDNNDGWDLDYNKPDTKVWSKLTENIDFKIIKLWAKLKDIEAKTIYDVLHDPDYRKIWDRSMIKCKDICMINPNNDIGYYAMRSPPPFKNRDFVTQRTWLQTASEFMIFNHSVFHKEMPPHKNFIRATSHLTGYLIRPDPETGGCTFTYIAQCDPKGKLPVWAVNKATQLVAPKVLQRLAKAAVKYPAWKERHRPNHKPWLYPEQMCLPRLRPQDLTDHEDAPQPIEDESQALETPETFAATVNTELEPTDSPLAHRKISPV